jgi:hypothetical protein
MPRKLTGNDGKIDSGEAFSTAPNAGVSMLRPDEKEKLERAFAEAEASLSLEGLTPTENFFVVKARILAGEISFEDGQEQILAYHHRAASSAVA